MNTKIERLFSLGGFTLIGQLFPFLTLIVVTRLYAPSDFAGLAQLVLYASVVLVFSTMRLEHVFISLKHRRIARILLGQIIVLSLIVSSVAAVGFCFFNAVDFFRLIFLSFFLLFSMSLFTATSSFAISNEKILLLGYARLLKGVIDGLLPIALYFVMPDERGLLLSLALSFFLPSILLFDKSCLPIKFKPLFLLHFASSFSRYELVSGLLNTVSAAIPVFVVAAIYDMNSAGVYAFINRYFAAVASLGMNSLGVLFRTAAVREKISTGIYFQALTETVKYSLVAVVVFLVAVLSVTYVGWANVLGDQWGGIDDIVLWLAGFYAVKIVSLPISYSLYISKALLPNLAFQISLFCLVVGVAGLAYCGVSFQWYVAIVSILLGFYYVIYVLYIVRLSKTRS
jgi:O-antigen/teichoic acid export membrane protein